MTQFPGTTYDVCEGIANAIIQHLDKKSETIYEAIIVVRAINPDGSRGPLATSTNAKGATEAERQQAAQNLLGHALLSVQGMEQDPRAYAAHVRLQEPNTLKTFLASKRKGR